MKKISREVLTRYLRAYTIKHGILPLAAKDASSELRKLHRATRTGGGISRLGIMEGKQSIIYLQAQQFMNAATVIVSSKPDNDISVAQEVFIADPDGCHYQRIDGRDISPSYSVPWSEIFPPASKK